MASQAPPGTPVALPGSWVVVHRVLLPPGGRAPAVPPETQTVPLEMRVKGFLEGGPGVLGQTVTVRTLSGRLVSGSLVAVNPPVPHTFGAAVPELLALGPELRRRLGAPGGGPPPEAGDQGEERRRR